MTDEQRADWLGYEWPVTILADRYGGTYSGGAFLAFPVMYQEVPEGAMGGDIECHEFFLDADRRTYGTGRTPDEALADLKHRMGT